MQIGDLVKVTSKGRPNGAPYVGQVGILIEIVKRFGTIYYDVLLPGKITHVSFRKDVLGVINESR